MAHSAVFVCSYFGRLHQTHRMRTVILLATLMAVSANAQNLMLVPEPPPDSLGMERPGDLLIASAHDKRTSLVLALVGPVLGAAIALSGSDENKDNLAIAGGAVGVVAIGLSFHFGFSSANKLARAGMLLNEQPPLMLMVQP